MIKGVAFDFDCTLYNRTQVWERLIDRFMIRFSSEIDPALSRERVFDILRQGDAQGIIRDSDWRGIFEDYVKMGLFSHAPEYDVFYSFIHEEFPSAIVMHPDAAACIKALREMGLKTGILSNGSSAFARKKIHCSGADALMNYILVSGDIGIEKPDKRAFENLCAGMGTAIEETVFVGDHPEKDVCGAENAGMTAIWMEDIVPWPEGTKPPAYKVKSLSEVLTIVQKLLCQ